MKPILFRPDETKFQTLGLGVLNDATSCLVTEERNGVYELTMQYPITGRLFDQIQNRCILYAEVNQNKNRQPFRIYRITKPMRGIVTIYAQHLSYDLSGIVLTPFEANTIQAAFSSIKTQSSTANPFTFSTDRTTAATFSVKQPSTVRSIMGGQAGSLLDVYGGEYSYDHYTVHLVNSRGKDNGVTIRYGKNLTDLTQEENIQNVCTGVYPFWTQDAEYLELSEKLIYAPGTYDFTKIKPLDTSSHFEEKPTEAQLRSYAQSYVENNDIGVPTVSISVKFAALEQTEEYAEFAHLYRVNLCDTVTVLFDRLGVNATAKCIKTVYDVLKGRYKEIALGDAKTNITDTILSQGQEIKKVSDPAYVQSVVGSASQIITGNKGGYVVLHSSTGELWPDEILVMNTPSPATATNVWRWNKSGLGYSSNGYNGEYKLAMTIDGKFVADFISTGTLDATNLTVKNFWTDNLQSVGETDGGEPCELKITASNFQYIVNSVVRIVAYASTIGDCGFIIRDKEGWNKVILSSSGITTPAIFPASGADFVWEYNSYIGKTILVKKS